MAPDPDGQPSLVGRGRELAELTAFLARAADAGRGGAVLVAGEAGIGKTALLEVVQRAAQQHGWAVLHGRAYDLEQRLAFGPLAAALGGYLHGLPEAERRTLTEGLSSLAVLVEGLGAAPASTGDLELVRSRLFQSISLLLGRLAARSRVLVVVDDLHWADPATTEVLRYLSGDLDALGVVLAVAYRPADADLRPELRDLLGALTRLPVSVTVAPGRLVPDEIAMLAERVVGGAVHQSLVEQLAERTAGTPLAVEALVRDLAQRGVLQLGPGGWWSTDADPAAPAHVLDVFGRSIERLPDRAGHVLTVVALGGGPVEHDQLAAVAGGDLSSLASDLDTLRASGLLTELSDGMRLAYAVAHPLVGDAVLRRVGVASRTRLHARYLDVLDGSPDVAPDVLARHCVGARSQIPTERAVRVLGAAGRAALSRGAPESALRWLQAAADLTRPRAASDEPTALLRAGLLYDMASAQRQHGENSAAAASYREAAELYSAHGSMRKASDTIARAAWLHALTGDQLLAGQLGEAAVSMAADEGPDHRGWTRLTVASLNQALERPETAVLHVRQAETDIAAQAEGPRRRLQAGFAGYLLASLDLGRLVDAMAGLADPGVGDYGLDLACGNSRLDLLVALGRWADIEAEAFAAQDLVAGGEGRWRMWRAPWAEFHRRWAVGDWASAEDLVTELAVGRYTLRTDQVPIARAWIALHRGDPVAAETELDAAGAGLVDRDVKAFGTIDIVRALAATWYGPSPRVPAGGWATVFEPWRRLARVEAFAAARDFPALRAEAEQMHAVGPGSPLAALADRALALAEPDRRAAAEHAGRGVELYTALGMPFDAARVRLEAAEAGLPGWRHTTILRRDDLPLFERLGAEPWLRRCRTLLGLPTPRARGSLDLTPRQRDVAELVAEGLSNAQIAERLSVSVRTVTSHLDHTYTKLGISTRTALARYLHASLTSPAR